MPVSVEVKIAGNADSDTASRLKDAANDIGRQIKNALRGELPGMLQEINRRQTARAF
jgi:hypothetical protein